MRKAQGMQSTFAKNMPFTCGNQLWLAGQSQSYVTVRLLDADIGSNMASSKIRLCGSKQLCAVEQEGYWAVVGAGYVHVFAEDALFDRYALL